VEDFKRIYLILDLETGGLSAEKNPITQIAILAVNAETLKEVTRLETFVRGYDDLEYEEIALQKTGITYKNINNGIDAKELVRILIILFDRLKPKGDRGKNAPIIIGHNINFDISFLEYLFKRVDKNLSEYVCSNSGRINAIDTQQLAQLQQTIGKHTLGACCERIGIETPDSHHAMNDVLATKKLLEYFISLIRGDKKTKLKKTEGQKEEIENTEAFEFRKSFEF